MCWDSVWIRGFHAKTCVLFKNRIWQLTNRAKSTHSTLYAAFVLTSSLSSSFSFDNFLFSLSLFLSLASPQLVQCMFLRTLVVCIYYYFYFLYATVCMRQIGGFFLRRLSAQAIMENWVLSKTFSCFLYSIKRTSFVRIAVSIVSPSTEVEAREQHTYRERERKKWMLHYT